MDQLVLKHRPSVMYLIFNILLVTSLSISVIQKIINKQNGFFILLLLFIVNVIYQVVYLYNRYSDKIEFFDSYLFLKNRKRSIQVDYKEITLLEEKRNNTIIIHAKINHTINGIFSSYMSVDDKERTTNVIRTEIKKKSNLNLNIKYIK